MSEDGKVQIPLNTDPSKADPGYRDLFNNGQSIGEIDEFGNKIFYGFQEKRLVVNSDASPLESDNRNRVRLQTDDATHDFLMGLDGATPLTDDWETTIQQTGLFVLHLKSVAGVTINGVDNEDISLVGGIGQGTMTVERIGVNKYLAFGSQ